MRRFLVLSIVVVGLLVGIRYQARSSEAPVVGIEAIHALRGIPVRVEPSTRADLEDAVDITGQLEELLAVPAVSEVDGRMTEVGPGVGDRVTAGQVVARLDDRVVRANLASAEAQLAIARANLLKAERGARPQEVQVARGRRDEAAAALKLAGEELDRARSLVARHAAPQQSLDQATGAFDAATARLAQATDALHLVEEGTRAEDLDVARASVALAESQVALVRIGVEKHVVIAPIAGVVSERAVEPGDVIRNVPSVQVLLRLVAIDPILFVTDLSELYVPLVDSRTRVDVTVDAFPGESFAARLHELTPAGDAEKRSFRVEFAIDNPSLRLKPGMFARARLVMRRSRGAVTVPDNVLRTPAGVEAVEGAPAACLPVASLDGPGSRSVVMVDADGTAAARLVRVGIVAGGRAEILEGLAEGDLVVIDGYEELRAGQKVSR